MVAERKAQTAAGCAFWTEPPCAAQDGLDDVGSCLVEGRRGMKRALLEVVASRAVATAQDVQRFIKCTLLAATSDYNVCRGACSPGGRGDDLLRLFSKDGVLTGVRACMRPGQDVVTTTTLAARDWLQQHAFIRWDRKDKLWSPTNLGLACTAAGMDPDHALALKKARVLWCPAVFPCVLKGPAIDQAGQYILLRAPEQARPCPACRTWRGPQPASS